MKNEFDLDYYVQGIKDQKIEVLGKAITLIESRNEIHQANAAKLLNEILPMTGKSKRIGVSGTPGVGKSTFLENFGSSLIDKGERIAVLAVDPTSQITGGSILGDKTRMQKLSMSDKAFIRPSPNGDTLGGVAAKTREVMLLCEAYGFDTIFIETVGVGQSEIAVSHIVDFFILLMQPGSGDELQGIKRGILEVSNLVVVNKADGDQLPQAKIAKHDYERSLAVLKERSQWQTPVILCSSLKGNGFDEIYTCITEFFSKHFDSKSREQKVSLWIEELVVAKVNKKVAERLKNHKDIHDVMAGKKNLVEFINSVSDEFLK